MLRRKAMGKLHVRSFLSIFVAWEIKDKRLGGGKAGRKPKECLHIHAGKGLGMFLDESWKACGGGEILVGMSDGWEPLVKESESEVAQSCLTPCNPMDCSLPGSSIHGIYQARVLEWVATSFSYICMYLVSTNPKLPIYPSPCLPFSHCKFVFYVCESVSIS